MLSRRRAWYHTSQSPCPNVATQATNLAAAEVASDCPPVNCPAPPPAPLCCNCAAAIRRAPPHPLHNAARPPDVPRATAHIAAHAPVAPPGGPRLRPLGMGSTARRKVRLLTESDAKICSFMDALIQIEDNATQEVDGDRCEPAMWNPSVLGCVESFTILINIDERIVRYDIIRALKMRQRQLLPTTQLNHDSEFSVYYYTSN